MDEATALADRTMNFIDEESSDMKTSDYREGPQDILNRIEDRLADLDIEENV